jgi:hypothetical protein
MGDLEQLASPLLFCKSHPAYSNGIQGAPISGSLRKRYIKGMKLEMYDL